MATNPRVPPLGLTRDQLATFLKDHEQIKQFENLFAVAATVAPDNVEVANILAGNADAKAVQALGQIAALAQEVAVCCSISDIKGTQALDQIAMLAQETAVSIASAENKANQAMALLSRLAEAVEGLQMLPPKREFKRSRYGSFYDTTTQTATAINTAKAITFNTTDLSHGVYLGTPTSRVYVDTEGIYNFQISVQLDSTVATAEEFYVWFRLNGADVTNSASQVRIQGNNAEVFVALNLFFNLKAGDYVEVMFSVSNLGVQLLASGAVAPHPGIPSIILTVANNIGGIQ
jgi:uncharacterized protein YhbP (UPF0306 family)